MYKCSHRSVCTRYRALKKTCIRAWRIFSHVLSITCSTPVGMSVGLISQHISHQLLNPPSAPAQSIDTVSG